ncbi:MAG TPA: hypothetical protein VMT66_09685 [Steroidobacteraceae bacterium]|nr:hypothetical protein [Steroidobacteraceae bacterium]
MRQRHQGFTQAAVFALGMRPAAAPLSRLALPQNWGSNRWGFKPEVGCSQRWDHWILEGYLGVWFFTTNPDYYPGEKTRTEKPVGAVAWVYGWISSPKGR